MAVTTFKLCSSPSTEGLYIHSTFIHYVSEELAALRRKCVRRNFHTAPAALDLGALGCNSSDDFRGVGGDHRAPYGCLGESWKTSTTAMATCGSVMLDSEQQSTSCGSPRSRCQQQDLHDDESMPGSQPAAAAAAADGGGPSERSCASDSGGGARDETPPPQRRPSQEPDAKGDEWPDEGPESDATFDGEGEGKTPGAGEYCSAGPAPSKAGSRNRTAEDAPRLETPPRPSPRRLRGKDFKLWCHFHLDEAMLHDEAFALIKKIIGTKGSNTSYIHQETGAKVRVRGRGSGHAEWDDGSEADVPLMLAVTLPWSDPRNFHQAIRLSMDLLEDVERKFQIRHRENPERSHHVRIGELPRAARECLQHDKRAMAFMARPEFRRERRESQFAAASSPSSRTRHHRCDM
mmetsp:Transcript_48389/g.115059  ORF Transcript_48389/g.115059 Transcript_48389/m.115059 type:complete len:405 (+) Transcript_48389:127-1341(+)|eukprot:CAMPEP_0178406988 /NCGR_PEP_ID=MMETSP0689_2-20121128/19196_1 /TAXON_ID=160604 /ORGANISM="Amphidinium massartii, Strain CS-259" /LENGTH=404 /DNA_ID=CAMNT_0020028047 /DNA_START=40 /DNA_END=1254 /DNA_ORIENTATION=-